MPAATASSARAAVGGASIEGAHDGASGGESASFGNQLLPQQTGPLQQHRGPSMPGGCVLGMPVQYPQARVTELVRVLRSPFPPTEHACKHVSVEWCRLASVAGLSGVAQKLVTSTASHRHHT